MDPGSVVYGPSADYQIAQLPHLWSRPGDGVVVHTPMYDAFPEAVAADVRRLLECPLRDWAELERLLALPDTAVLSLLPARSDRPGVDRAPAGPDGRAVRGTAGR